jgi:hypothetical protein
MTRIRRRTILFLLVLVLISVLGAYLCSILIMWPITAHVGDGQFRDISWRYPWVTVGTPVTGYSITFEQFDLSKSYTASYTLEKVPDIGKDVYLYLCVADPRHTLRADVTRQRLKAKIHFDVADEHGNSVCHVDKPLAKMYWADPEGGADCYGLYSLPESVFVSRKGAQYRLHIRYSPDPQISGFRGFVFIRCGGSI